jgi:hypothetical protein
VAEIFPERAAPESLLRFNGAPGALEHTGIEHRRLTGLLPAGRDQRLGFPGLVVNFPEAVERGLLHRVFDQKSQIPLGQFLRLSI